MFKLDHKLKISLIGTAVLFGLTLQANVYSDAKNTYANGKRVIDGGMTYPIVNKKTSAYTVNTQKQDFHYGRTPTSKEIKELDIDVMPDGTGLPDGKGSVEEGEEIYESKCVACHKDFGSGGDGYPALAKGNAYEGQKTLKNQRTTPDKDGPIRVFGTYWPQASTLWWYIKTGMPHNAPMTLTNDQVYALCAYILNINEMKIDGQEVDDEYVLDRAKFLKIVMPNKDGFVPKINEANGVENVRKFLNDPNNYGNGKRCMSGCKPGTKIVRISTEINDFLPPMSTKRDLPKEDGKKSGNSKAKEIYASTCAMCHDSGAAGAPKLGDKGDWAARIKKGMDKLYDVAIHGKGAMPAKGGKTSLKDDDVKAVVDFMVEKSK